MIALEEVTAATVRAVRDLAVAPSQRGLVEAGEVDGAGERVMRRADDRGGSRAVTRG